MLELIWHVCNIFKRNVGESIIVYDNMVKHNESEWNSSLLGRKNNKIMGNS